MCLTVWQHSAYICNWVAFSYNPLTHPEPTAHSAHTHTHTRSWQIDNTKEKKIIIEKKNLSFWECITWDDKREQKRKQNRKRKKDLSLDRTQFWEYFLQLLWFWCSMAHAQSNNLQMNGKAKKEKTNSYFADFDFVRKDCAVGSVSVYAPCNKSSELRNDSEKETKKKWKIEMPMDYCILQLRARFQPLAKNVRVFHIYRNELWIVITSGYRSTGCQWTKIIKRQVKKDAIAKKFGERKMSSAFYSRG